VKKSIELRQERSGLLTRGGEITNLCGIQNRHMTADENREFHAALSKADLLQYDIIEAEEAEAAEKDRFEGRSTSSSSHTQGPRVSRESQVAEYAVTTKGEKIRLLGPNQSIRSVVSNTLPDDARPEDFSIGRAIRGMATGDWKGSDLERRTLLEGSGVGGGYLVPEIISSEFLDLARNKAVVFQAGARTIPMTSAELILARLTSDATAEWKGENVALTGSDVTFGAFTLKAKTLACLVTSSIELLEDAANLDSIVRDSISQALALELDRAILRGIPGGARITGLRYWYPTPPAIQVIDMGTDGDVITYDRFSTASEMILTANGTPNAAIYAPRTAGVIDRWRTIDGQPMLPPPSFQALNHLISNQVPIDLVKGESLDASEAYVGDFTKILVGMRTQLQIEVSRVAGDSFQKGQVQIRAYLRADALPTQPAHFVLIDGIIPAGS
jgi:HK97 family phage major capsid protein